MHYDCFGDGMQVTITEDEANQLKALITMPNADTTDLTLNYGSNTMEVTNHVWYGIKTYKIDFSNLQYKTTYSLKTEYEYMQDR